MTDLDAVDLDAATETATDANRARDRRCDSSQATSLTTESKRQCRDAQRSANQLLLLDGPQQTARLVQIAIVWPAVERGKALVAGVRPTPAVGNPVGACAVPSHPDKQRTVVS